MALSAQDLAIVLKLCGYSPEQQRPPYSRIAFELSLSPSQVHTSVKRAQASHLIRGVELGERPNLSAVEEFLIHGVKYAFPAKHGEPTRGVLTAYAAEPLRRMIARSRELPPVWPYIKGNVQGLAFEPLYKYAPVAALRDPVLYEYLALVDALRDGRTRERKLAEEMIVNRLRSTAHA